MQPWYEPAAAPSVCAVLERAYAAIRSEAAQLLRTEKWPHADDDEDLAVTAPPASKDGAPFTSQKEVSRRLPSTHFHVSFLKRLEELKESLRVSFE